MTTTMISPFKYVSAGKSFAGTPKWDVFSTADGAYLGFVSSMTSKRGGTSWAASTGSGSARGFRNRNEAATCLGNKS